TNTRRTHHGIKIGLGNASTLRGDARSAEDSVRSACSLGASYTGLIVRICFVCGIARPGGNYRRRRRCSSSGGSRGGKDIAPRAGCSDGVEIIERDGFTSLDGTNAGGDSSRNTCDRESGSNKRSLVRCSDHVGKTFGVSRSDQTVSRTAGKNSPRAPGPAAIKLSITSYGLG